ncbi:hypothetical protein D9M71_234480 [compost metagenome]
MRFGKHTVSGQTMVGEGHVLAQAAVEHGVAVGRGVVVGEGTKTACLLVIGGKAPHVFHRIDALPGLFQRARVDVGSVDDGALQQALLAQQDGHGIHFFTRAATGNPYLDRGVGLEQRHHIAADGQEVLRVAKHLADRDSQVLQQMHERTRVMQYALLQGRYGIAFKLTQRVLDTPLDRGPGVISKIVAVLEVDGLNQQADFDLQIMFHGHDHQPVTLSFEDTPLDAFHLRQPHPHQRK